ncbi:hypothetical protein [Campylobacter concisus]|uniref:hypothetical protein n=1 Tax=Campylobacter concisus TaxID=199 RepID=UPI000CD92F4A|nr:hypothetical protein [Campylobacter concisus]
MKFLLKILCLLSLLSSFSFTFDMPSVYELGYFRDNSLNRYYFRSSVDALILPDDFVKVDNDVYRSDICSVDYVNLSLGISWGGFQFDSRNLILYSYFSSFEKKDAFCNFNVDADSDACFDRKSSCGAGCKDVTFSYVKHCSLSKFTTCNTGENFNTNLKQCVPACPAGQSWDAENNLCYVDCSDKNLNKYGYPNGTAQGGCVDCSNALSDAQIMRCACSGFGSSYDPGVILIDPPYKFGSCLDGKLIRFKPRLNDNDKDEDKKKDNNSTNSSDKDNKKEDTKPNKKDNNENSNNSSGENGNSSNNNSGGSAGNGSSGGGGTGVETKPNPNYNGNGKQDGKGEEGKGDDAVAQKLDYGDLKKDADKFKSDFKGALDDVISKTQDFKNSLDGLISKIKEGGLMKFNQSAIPSTCPLSFEINFIVSNKQITFDICKVLAPVSQTLYYFFYIAFFVLFLVLIVKLFLFTFMGL